MTRVLITGAADGIGRALLERYAHAGASVVGVDVDADRAASLADAGDVRFHHADLADRDAVDGLAVVLANEPAFDVVIHNAGISHVGAFEHSDLDAQRAVIRVNLEAPLVLTAALLRANRVAEGGAIVFVSSLSHYVGYPGASVYAATKDGLAAYARSLSVALAPEGIHVLRVFPGPTRTEHARRYSPEGSDESKRMSPDEVARRIVAAVGRKKPVLVPGAGNKVFAAAGRVVPGVTERALRKALFEKL